MLDDVLCIKQLAVTIGHQTNMVNFYMDPKHHLTTYCYLARVSKGDLVPKGSRSGVVRLSTREPRRRERVGERMYSRLTQRHALHRFSYVFHASWVPLRV